MVEGKGTGRPLNLAKRLTQRACHKRSWRGIAETFGLVLGCSSGSFTNQLNEIGRLLALSGFQFPVYKTKVIIPVCHACLPGLLSCSNDRIRVGCKAPVSVLLRLFNIPMHMLDY